MRRARSLRLIPLLSAALVALAAAGADNPQHPRHAVSMRGLQFKPAELKIDAGDTVVWTNDDDADHTVVGKQDTFKSGIIRRGETFSFTFDKPGKYPYACRFHPRMKGLIVVERRHP